MNIWIVNHYAIPPSMGGLVRHYYFSKYLQKKGHSVKIFASSKIHNTDINIIDDNILYKEKVMDGVEYTFVRSRNYRGNGVDRIFNMVDLPFKMWKTMKYFWKYQEPDVIYTSSPDLFVAFFAVLFGRKHKVPVVVEVRDLWPESIVDYNGVSSKNPIIICLYQLEKWIYKKANQLIFTIPGGREYIIDKKWDKVIDLNKINHVNNGVDLEEYKSNLTKYKIDDDDLNDEDKFKVVYVGSVRKVNNVGVLVETAGFLKEEKDIIFLIYGDGTEREKLEKKCCKYGVNVFFKGRVEKKYIPYILSKSNLNLINVKEAGINKYGCSWNKLFEYMASGTPILCNLPVAYDLIREHDLGISKKFESSRSYADEIRKFKKKLENNPLYYQENLEECVKDYDYKILADKIEEILKNAIGN